MCNAMEARLVSGEETAGLVAQCLGESFPEQTFTVRTDGNTLDIEWTDGPTADMVRSVAGRFEFGLFDDKACATLDGAPVRFGVSFILVHRHYSHEFLQAVLTYAKRVYRGRFGCAEIGRSRSGKSAAFEGCDDADHTLLMQIARRRNEFVAPKRSTTAARLAGVDVPCRRASDRRA